mmetsp:Transcript_11615/g.21555  ORF Transcript_11615/g.21555 Transcript_11615/m.21555 type:complete len:197 (+) Transcript_11615:401-991(+)
MREIAAQANGKELALSPKATAAVPLDGAGDAEEAAAIGHLGDLGQDAAGLGEGLMYVPQRAGATVAGEMEARGTLALGDIARLVDSHEVERYAASPIALQRGQSVADGLEADVEALLQQLHVIAAAARGVEEGPVGQQHRTSEVVGQALAGQRARCIIGEASFANFGGEGVGRSQQRVLRGHLEGLLCISQMRRQA